MIKVALLGNPVSHSLSPRLHNKWFALSRINGSYESICASQDELESILKSLTSQGYTGFNITSPLKRRAFQLCDVVDKAASETGVVNAILFKDNKKLGFNYDVEAFYDTLRKKVTRHTKTYIIGAGDTTKSILLALDRIGIKDITITSISNNSYIALEDFEDKLDDCELLINTVPYPVSIDKLKKGALVYDIRYNSPPLLQIAHEKGFNTINGMAMLIKQAKASFKLFCSI